MANTKHETALLNNNNQSSTPTPQPIQEELDTLVEIFPEITFHTYPTHILVIFPIPLVEDQLIQITSNTENHLISALIPVQLQISLPLDYPSTSVIPHFHLSACYVSTEDLKIIADQLESNWYMEEPILFQWALIIQDNLRQRILKEKTNPNDRFDYQLEITECEKHTKDSRICRFSQSTQEVLDCILSYARRITTKRLNQGLWKCPSCWELISGQNCIQLQTCQHISCKECLKGFWETRINDGKVSDNDLICPELDCRKSAKAYEIRMVLNEKMIEKWQHIIQTHEIETLNNLTCCIRKECEGLAWIDEDESSLAQCGYCNYNFCIKCEKTWHGKEECSLNKEIEQILSSDDEESMNKNKTKSLERLLEKIEQGEEEESEFILSQLGPKTKEMVLTRLSIRKSNMKKCPCCEIDVEKNGGCAKMSCLCGIDFCWNCNQVIEFGYSHFEPGNGCALYEEADRQQLHEEIWYEMMDVR